MPQPTWLVAITAREAPAIRPRTQRGVIGLRCRADWNMVYSPPWERARSRRQAIQPHRPLGAGTVVRLEWRTDPCSDCSQSDSRSMWSSYRTTAARVVRNFWWPGQFPSVIDLVRPRPRPAIGLGTTTRRHRSSLAIGHRHRLTPLPGRQDGTRSRAGFSSNRVPGLGPG